MAGLTRGPLEAEVYWRRRLVVIALALLLVLGIARVLTLGSDASDGAGPGQPTGTAAQAGATPTSTGATSGPASPSATPLTKKQVRQARRAERKAALAQAQAAVAEVVAAQQAAAQAALPEAQGPCSDTDVVVDPTVPAAAAGGDVVIDLALRTRFSPACSWSISPDSLVLKITSGPEDIWSSQDCPGVIPTQDVTLRRAVATDVQVVWNGKRSDDDCTSRTDWGLPGYYHVLAAALAGEPTDVQFELSTPSAPQVTRTAEPKPQATQQKNKSQDKAKNKNQKKKQQSQ